MTIEDAFLSAYIDGELAADERARVEAALAASPALKSRLAALRRASAEALATLSDIDHRPLPASVQALLATPAPVASIVAAAPRRQAVWSQPLRSMALAASVALVVGVGAGHFATMELTLNSRMATQSAGLIQASSPLYAVLEKAPSAYGETVGATTMTPVLTFATVDGAYCREFVVTGAKAASRNLACRDDGQWRLVAMTAVAATATDHYAPAGGSAGVIDAAIDGLIAGDPMDAAAETQLIAKGWR